ncbi:MAG: Flp pilus assembly protein CpaB [Streptosporangiaceae bacterium]
MTVTLAALLAVFGIVAVLAYVANTKTRIVKDMSPEYVLVAKAPIASGTRAEAALNSKLLVREQLPTSSIPIDAVHSITADISNLVTSTAIQPGQLLLKEMLVPAREVTGAIAIPDGKVALSVELCLAQDVAGYVKPGSHIAVFDTFQEGSNQNLEQSCQSTHQAQNKDSVYTRLLLPDVEVLSVSAAAPPAGTTSSGGAVLTSGATAALGQGAVFVTVAATQSQAEQLILAAQTGLPYFALTTLNSGITRDTQPAQLFKQ